MAPQKNAELEYKQKKNQLIHATEIVWFLPL